MRIEPPSVSVVIPTYKHCQYICETLRSVIDQSSVNLEIIVVNDGSPDDTKAVVAPYHDRGEVTYIEQVNAGQACARNRGLLEAKGEFVAFLDDDDLWPPDSLQARINAMACPSRPVMAYGYNEFVGRRDGDRFPRSRIQAGESYADFLIQNWMWSPGQAIFRTRAVKEIGGFDTSVWGADDWDLYIRLSKIGAIKFIEHCTLRYRMHDANASKDVLRMYRNITKVRHRHLGRVPNLKNSHIWWRARASWGRSFSTSLSHYASQQWTSDRKMTALRAMWAAFCASPLCVLKSCRLVRLSREWIRRFPETSNRSP